MAQVEWKEMHPDTRTMSDDMNSSCGSNVSAETIASGTRLSHSAMSLHHCVFKNVFDDEKLAKTDRLPHFVV